MTDGLIIWHDMDNPVIREFLDNKNNTAYISTIEEFEKVMIAEEKIEAKLNSLTETSQSKKDINCKNWHKRYVDAYDRRFDQGAKVGERGMYEMIEFLQIS
jgi:ferritin